MSEPANSLIKAILANPVTNWTGILSTRKVVEIENGYLSYNQDRELLALALDDPRYGYYYGHVLRVEPGRFEQAQPGKPVWAALILWAARRIDADRPDILFQRYRYWIQIKGRYGPIYAQNDGDVFALKESYELAVQALADMIRIFDLDLREDFSTPLREESIPLTGIPRILDMRCFDVYGGIMAGWDGNDPEQYEKFDGICP